MTLDGLPLKQYLRRYFAAFARADRDKRARAVVRHGSYLFVYVPAYLCFWGYMIWREPYASQAFISYAVLGAAAAAVVFWIRRANRQQDEVLQQSFSVAGPVAAYQTSRPVRDGLGERMRIVAALFVRAVGENVPDQVRDARQHSNELLRSMGLWEKLEPDERELAAMPDAEWTNEQKSLVAEWSEQLRLLRWTFRLDSELLQLAYFPQPDGKLLDGILSVDPPAWPETLRPPWELREQRDIAHHYASQALAEMEVRGLVRPTPEEARRAQTMRALATPSTDLVVGARTIGELPERDLLNAYCLASARAIYAAYLADVLSEDQWISFQEWKQEPATSPLPERSHNPKDP